MEQEFGRIQGANAALAIKENFVFNTDKTHPALFSQILLTLGQTL